MNELTLATTQNPQISLTVNPQLEDLVREARDLVRKHDQAKAEQESAFDRGLCAQVTREKSHAVVEVEKRIYEISKLLANYGVMGFDSLIDLWIDCPFDDAEDKNSTLMEIMIHKIKQF